MVYPPVQVQETQETQVQSLSLENPWRRKWQPTLVFLTLKSHGQRSLVIYSLWSCKESNKTEHVQTHTWFNMIAGSSKSLFVSKSLLEWISLYLWRFYILSLVAQASSKDEWFPFNISKIYKFSKLLYTFNSKFYYSNLYMLLCELHVTASQPWLLLQSSRKFKILTTGFHHQNFWLTEFGCDPSMRILKSTQVVLVCAQGWQLLIQVKPLFQRWRLRWVLTLFMDKCWRSKRDHSSKRGDMRTLMW